MLIHYIKIAWKVLLRRKLFSFISLFGICFTLVVLMLLASLMENEFGTNAPFSNKHDIVNIRNIEQKHVEIDTIYEIDSSRIVNEKIQYDTIDFKTQEESRTTASSNFSIKVFEDYLIHLKTPLHKAIISSEDVNIYRNNKKIVLHQIFTNEEYWEIMNFKFIEGKPFNKKNVDNREKGVVITKKAKKDFFGNIGSVLGKEITYENNTYQVMGLVENSNSTYRLTHADIFIPYTLLPKIILEDKDNMGPFSMVTLAKNKGDIENIKQEVTKLSKMVEPVSHPLSKYPFNQVKLNTNTYTEGYAMSLFNSENENNVRNLFLILLAATLLFILIPTINLININVSRIAERSSEIGTRKAFGATPQNLIYQFVTENIIITLIGGASSFLISFLLIYTINNSSIGSTFHLAFNGKLFIYSFLICILFGIISGIIPAWRMSKLHIVEALNGKKK